MIGEMIILGMICLLIGFISYQQGFEDGRKFQKLINKIDKKDKS